METRPNGDTSLRTNALFLPVSLYMVILRTIRVKKKGSDHFSHIPFFHPLPWKV